MKRYVATALTAAVCFASGCMNSSGPTASTTPAATKVEMPTMPATQPTAAMPPAAPAWDAPVEGKPIYFHARADGVQVYVAKDDGGKLAWALKGPEALLYDDRGRNVGKHMAGPTGPVWELSDGSKVIGEKVASMDKPGALPWLMITVKSHDGPKGKLTSVGYLKRIDTDGGLPPATPPAAAGAEENVPYRATYVFFAGK